MTIIGYRCGHRCIERFNAMGLNIGREFSIVCEEPGGGPYVIDIDGHQLTIGRGMYSKLILKE